MADGTETDPFERHAKRTRGYEKHHGSVEVWEERKARLDAIATAMGPTRDEAVELLGLKPHEVPEGYANLDGSPRVTMPRLPTALPGPHARAWSVLLARAADEAEGACEEWHAEEKRKESDGDELQPREVYAVGR